MFFKDAKAAFMAGIVDETKITQQKAVRAWEKKRNGKMLSKKKTQEMLLSMQAHTRAASNCALPATFIVNMHSVHWYAIMRHMQ
eukprot:1158222-Pelagomonas_calceolata.AAC.6